MKKLLCRVFGHKMNVVGITGEYRWCSRCAHREPVILDLGYDLPEGFIWKACSPAYLRFQHVVSGKLGAVSHCERAVTPDNEIQGVINYNCAKLLREASLDALWLRCGSDPKVFEKRRLELNQEHSR